MARTPLIALSLAATLYLMTGGMLAATAQTLLSGQIEHPAVPGMVTDRRLDVDDDRTARLVEQVMAFSDEEIDELILPKHGLASDPVCVCPARTRWARLWSTSARPSTATRSASRAVFATPVITRWRLQRGRSARCTTRPVTRLWLAARCRLWRASRRSMFMYEIPQDLVFAYDLTYDSAAWDALSVGTGDELRREVEDALMRPALALALDVHEQMGGHITNLNPTLYQRMIHLGRVLNEPDTIHQAVAFMRDMIRMSYHFDGMEYEGAMCYHGIVTGRLGIAMRMLSGYVDPEGYVDERFGFSIGRGEHPLDFPIHAKAWQVWGIHRTERLRALRARGRPRR